MSYRTIVITQRCKLDFCMNYVEVQTAVSKKRIFIDEIKTLIIENTGVAITAYLLSELMNRKVNLIFCDKAHNPQSSLLPLHARFDSIRKIKQQMIWLQEIKDEVWDCIVKAKIRQQALFLDELEKKEQSKMLMSYLDDVVSADAHNREGHAAKVYFNALFGNSFTRDLDSPINAGLNYGYSLLLSLFNREIVSAGYLTQLGIFHENTYNPYNFSCDLMEPFRILVDRYVYNMNPTTFAKDEKREIINLFQEILYIDDSRQFLANAINIYANSIFQALEKCDTSKIKIYEI